ncbi:ABC transporter substrate-binding protein [Brucellaceae bacterium D45D]
MTFTRRAFLHGSAAVISASTLHGLVVPKALAAAPSGTLRIVMHGDLRSFDPVWTTATVTGYHSALIYDTLLGIDAEGNVQPQMVDNWTRAEDGLRYDFTLRGGLSFSDGSPVTPKDCVASMKRWATRDPAGQIMFSYVADTPITGDNSFAITLSEPWGLVLETLGKTSNCLWIMREAEALTPSDQQIPRSIGSGPFVLNAAETKIGASYVYDRNPNYIPRSEPASGTAGGKVAKLDRVIWENIADPQTAVAALQSGEIDFYEVPPLELLSQIETDSNISVKVLNELGIIGFFRMNCLTPPFNNQKAREAMLYVVNQLDVMRATFGDPRYFKACDSLWGIGTAMETHVNTDWFKHGQDLKKAAALFKEAGYNGEEVVILQGTTLPMPNMAAQLVAQWLQKAGINAKLAPSDWGGVVARRAIMGTPAEGGWNIFISYNPASTFNSPISYPGWQMNGKQGFFGWPQDDAIEQMRTDWTFATSLEERRAIAEKMQMAGWDYVPQIMAGQWQAPVAMRRNVTGFLPIPDLIPFWNVEKA